MTHIKYLVLALALAAAPAWACTPEFDCDLFSRSCQRINSESCAKKNFGEGENTKYGSEVDCLLLRLPRVRPPHRSRPRFLPQGGDGTDTCKRNVGYEVFFYFDCEIVQD